MSSSEDLGCAGTLVMLAFMAAIIGAVMMLAPFHCNQRTKGMTLEHRYVWFGGGCQVRDPRAGWVPLENYRVL